MVWLALFFILAGIGLLSPQKRKHDTGWRIGALPIWKEEHVPAQVGSGLLFIALGALLMKYCTGDGSAETTGRDSPPNQEVAAHDDGASSGEVMPQTRSGIPAAPAAAAPTALAAAPPAVQDSVVSMSPKQHAELEATGKDGL